MVCKNDGKHTAELKLPAITAKFIVSRGAFCKL